MLVAKGLNMIVRMLLREDLTLQRALLTGHMESPKAAALSRLLSKIQ